MAPIKVKNYRWKKPPTLMYKRNYELVEASYEPMITYIDNKNKKALSNFPHSLSKMTSLSLSDSKVGSSNKLLIKEQTLQRQRKEVSTEQQHSENKKSLLETKSRKLRAMDYFDEDLNNISVSSALHSAKKILRGKSAKAIESQLLSESLHNMSSNTAMDLKAFQRNQMLISHDSHAHMKMMEKRIDKELDKSITEPLDELRHDLKGFNKKTTNYFIDKSKLNHFMKNS